MQPIVRVKTKSARNSSQSSISSSQTTEQKQQIEKKPEQRKKKESQSQSFEQAAKKFSFQKVFSLEDWKQEDVIEWRSPGNPFHKEEDRKEKKPWWHLALSIGGAIAIGSMMGFSILQLFFDDQKEIPPNLVDSTVTTAKVEKVTEQTKPTTTPVPSSEKTTVNKFDLPVLQSVFIQGGSYKEQAAAQKMVQTYRTKGLAALMSEKAPYNIYLGMASSRDDALKLNQVVREQEIEVYLKDFRLEAKGLIEKQKNTSKDLIATVGIGHELFQEFAKRTAAEMPTNGNQVGSMEQKDYTARHQDFITKSQSISKRLSTESQTALSEMTRAIDLMVESAKMAQKSPNIALLWQIQEGLLRYAFAYENLIESLK